MARALTALTIGPMDPSGRDGLLADLKTFSALGLHGCAVVTSVTGSDVDASVIASQLEDVLGTVSVDAVKLAAPGSASILEVIADALARHDVQRLVLDPGDAVLNDAASEVLKTRLLPLSLVALPNIAEAEALSGQAIETWDNARDAARAIAEFGAANVVIKGGKRAGDQVTDLLYDSANYRDYTAQRVQLANTPGIGTAFAAAVTATLAKQETVHHSIAAAKAYVTKSLQDAYELGGRPALHHFYRYWRPSGH